jgi:enoyl-CoA hydratase/carnithine racemase
MTVTLTHTGPVATIVLDRPAKHNAMTPQMAMDLAAIREQINADDAVRAVVLRGGGDRAFSAGSDLNALDEYDGVWAFRNRVEYAAQIRGIGKPVVAAIKGWALGGGLEMALSADIRFAAPSARFGAPEVTRGWVGAGGGSQLLPRLIGFGRASYLLLHGGPIDAQKAESWGLIERLTTEDSLFDEAAAFADEIAAHTDVALQTVKASIRQSLSTGLAEGLAYENEVMALAFALGNDAEGRAAFDMRKNTTG